MRKSSLIGWVLFLSFFLIGSTHAENNGMSLGDYHRFVYIKQSLELQSPLLLEHLIVLPTEHFNENEAERMISRIDHLPSSLLEKLNNKNIKLKLFTGKLTDNPTAHYLEGIIPRGYKNETTWDDVPGIGGSKTVLAKIGYSEKGKGHSSINLELHELAHSIDSILYNNISSTKQFHAIWNLEKAKLFPDQDYFLTYAEEYFAESLAMYYLNNDSRNLLKERAPSTYQLIKELK